VINVTIKITITLLILISLLLSPATKPGERKKKQQRDSAKFADDGKLIVSDEEHEGDQHKRAKKPGPGMGQMEVTLDDIIEEVGTNKLGKKRRHAEAELSEEDDGDDNDGRSGGPRSFLKAKSKGKGGPPRRLGEEYSSKVRSSSFAAYSLILFYFILFYFILFYFNFNFNFNLNLFICCNRKLAVMSREREDQTRMPTFR
jgi:hypothetical protein